jgi:hypothetical protein
MLSALDPKHAEPHGMLMRAKSNIGPRRGGFEFSTETRSLPDDTNISAQRILWGDYVDEDARDILARYESKVPVHRKAAMFLREALGGKGPRMAFEVIAEGEAAGLSEWALRRALKKLGGTSEKASFGTGWIWELPQQAS